MEKEDIIERIVGLLALADPSRNDSEEERKTAFKLARKLMIKWKIEEWEVNKEQQNKEVVQQQVVTYERWTKDLACNIAYFCGGKVIYLMGKKISFNGYKETVDQCVHIYNRLRRICVTSCHKTHAHLPSFGIGFAYAIYKRFEEAKQENKEEEQYAMVLQSELNAIKERYPNLRYKQTKRIRVDGYSYHKGYETGKTANIHQDKILSGLQLD